MTKLGVDFEHADRTWWEAGGAELWEGIAGDREAGSIVVDDDLAASWLSSAAKVPGWASGPEYAPHPIRATPLGEDDPEA
jgi:hypothetical protein